MKRSCILFLLSGLIISMATSCKKESGKTRKDITLTSTTWYRFSPNTPSAVTVNGTNYTSFAHVPGGGTGNNAELGNFNTFFNQLAYTSDATVPQPVPEGSVPASVSLVAAYPVLGAPLPLIQTGDFSALAAAHTTLQIPAKDAANRVINTVFFNSGGDAIFMVASGPSVIVPASATRFNFTGNASVAGGRGKFANATGEFVGTGYFNPQNPNEASHSYTGWIEY